jgi:hypothetical protein
MHSIFAISSVSKEISVILATKIARILAAEEDIPHEIKDSLINVWVGIVGNHLVGPSLRKFVKTNMLLLTITVVLICCLSLCCSLNNNKSLYKFHPKFTMKFKKLER